jgi:hypothetical protein
VCHSMALSSASTSLKSSKTASRCCAKSACCKHMFQVFNMLQRYVSSVSYECCKSRLGCCICCNGCTCMFQTSIPNVSSIFQTFVASVFISMLHMFHTYVANVLS